MHLPPVDKGKVKDFNLLEDVAHEYHGIME